jgi:UDP-glucose 4-epimerase
VRVLVTGATGLIGRHTVAALRQHGYAVRTFQRERVEAVETVQGDVRTDLQALCAAARGCEAIVHLAGRGDVAESRHDPVGYAELNATGTLHALDAARVNDAVFVLASSQRVYPLQPEACTEDQPLAPDSPYGYAKWVAELWCRMAAEQFGVNTRVLRFFSVFGPGQQPNGGSGVVSIFAQAALRGDPLIVQSAGRRDFTDARDVARGILLAIDDAKVRSGFRVYNLATGSGTSFLELAETIVGLTHSSSAIRHEVREPEGRDLVADAARARDELGFEARIPLKEGLEHYLQWLKQHSCC